MFRSALVMGLAAAVAVACPGLAQEPPLGDPMRPFRVDSGASVPSAGPRRLQLSAVLVSDQRRIALINGRFYREGDEVNGARITRIESGSVRLRRGGEDMVLRLVEGATSASDPANNQGEPPS